MSNVKSRRIAYIKKCSELCWSMVIKDPPMVLVLDKEGTPFDKNIFSPYTSDGNTIDFVIWPALLLHKDGPVMAKGIAQGKQNTKTEFSDHSSRTPKEVKGLRLTKGNETLKT